MSISTEDGDLFLFLVDLRLLLSHIDTSLACLHIHISLIPTYIYISTYMYIHSIVYVHPLYIDGLSEISRLLVFFSFLPSYLVFSFPLIDLPSYVFPFFLSFLLLVPFLSHSLFLPFFPSFFLTRFCSLHRSAVDPDDWDVMRSDRRGSVAFPRKSLQSSCFNHSRDYRISPRIWFSLRKCACNSMEAGRFYSYLMGFSSCRCECSGGVDLRMSTRGHSEKSLSIEASENVSQGWTRRGRRRKSSFCRGDSFFSSSFSSFS